MSELAAVLGRVADSIRENGATAEQAAVMEEIRRVCDRPGRPAALRLAARGLVLVTVGQVTA
jgi:hypothetical protein